MTTSGERGLSPAFMHALCEGHLVALAERLRTDSSLCLGIRDESINVYYRGGNLIRVAFNGASYVATFDEKYFRYAGGAPPASSMNTPVDVDRWLGEVPRLKGAMDEWFGRHRKDEREIQQWIVRDNNFGSIANSTDYYVCDLEYACEDGRFDLVGVQWPSTSSARQKAAGRRLVVAEVKHGESSLTGSSGLHAHVASTNRFLGDPDNVDRLKREMQTTFNQARTLGLISSKRDLDGFSDEPPMFVLMLANHDPASSILRRELDTLPPCPHADLYVATGNFMGYGLYEQGMLRLDDARVRWADRF